MPKKPTSLGKELDKRTKDMEKGLAEDADILQIKITTKDILIKGD